MKKYLYLTAIVMVVLSMFISFRPGTAIPNQAIPTFVVLSVVPDVRVTIRTANFPPNKDFTVTMGKNHTLGVGGVVVATTNSGVGGSFQATYNIPASLKGQAIIAIRLQATTGKYYAYNWFANSSTPQSTIGYYIPIGNIPTMSGTYILLTPRATLFRGYPYFGITGVIKDSKVSLSGANFPTGKDFKVLMGPYGTYGLGGAQVGSINTGSSPVFNATYEIPAVLKGYERIAIRMDSTDGAFYAYNWFFNRSTSGTAIATNLFFTIQSIVSNSSVTILAQNFPAKIEYEVFMGLYGTQGINGISVGTTQSTTGGSFTATFNIPEGLKGQERIAIRLVGKDGSYAYNWFYNVSAGS